MEMTVATRLKHAWNTFMNRDSYVSRMSIGPSYGYRPDRPLFSRGNERSIITSVYNRIALDVSSMTVQHVRLDSSDRFKEVIESGLNNCLTVEANVDQTGRAFMQDIVMSMLDEGCVAIILSIQTLILRKPAALTSRRCGPARFLNGSRSM